MEKDQFKTRLEIAKNKILKKSEYSKHSSSSKLGIAFKMSTEMVAAVVVGTIIGFILDNWFGTKPWLILIFFFVPRLNNIKIVKALIIINRLEFVKDISISPSLISGPILYTLNWCIGFVAILFILCFAYFLQI